MKVPSSVLVTGMGPAPTGGRTPAGDRSVTTDIHLLGAGSDDMPPVDERAKEIVEQNLEAKVRLKLLERALSAKAADRIVTLSGHLDGRDLRDQAEKTTKGTEEVGPVVSEIEQD